MQRCGRPAELLAQLAVRNVPQGQRFALASGCQQCFARACERQRAAREVGHQLEPLCFLAGLQVHQGHAIGQRQGRVFVIGRDGTTQDTGRITATGQVGEAMSLLVLGQVPDDEEGPGGAGAKVETGLKERLAVGAKFEAVGIDADGILSRIAADGPRLRAGLDIPQPQEAVDADRGHFFAIGRQRHPTAATHSIGQHCDFLPSGYVPGVNGAIATGARQHPTIGAEGHGAGKLVGVEATVPPGLNKRAAERVEVPALPASRHIPNSRGTILANGQQRLAIGLVGAQHDVAAGPPAQRPKAPAGPGG